MNKIDNKFNEFIDKAIDVLFLKKKTLFILAIICISGFILRIIAAINLNPLADDMHFAPGAIGFYNSGKLEYWDQSSGLWFLITDIFYKIFGTTQIASRMASILFGTLLIPLIFLISKRIFKNDDIALFSSIFVAFSNHAIKSMMAEMDSMAMFFLFFSVYLFLVSIDNKFKKNYLVVSGILVGLAIYTKVYPLLFIPGMIIFLFYSGKKEEISFYSLAEISLYFLIPAFLFCIPALTHNYLLFKDKGLMDHQFTRVFGSEEAKQQFSWIAGNDSKFSIKSLANGIIVVMRGVFFADPIIMILGLFGIAISLKRKEKHIYLWLLIVSLPLIYLCSVMTLIKHYLFLTLFFSLYAPLSFEKIWKKFGTKKTKIFLVILFIMLMFVYYGFNNVNHSFYQKSAVINLINFKESMEKDSLVVVDARIYRGLMFWMFNDMHFLEASYLEQLIAYSNNRTKIPITTYYVECARDDCGWGTIRNQPEFNKSMEDLTEKFRNISVKKTEIVGVNEEKWFGKNRPIEFIVYKTTLNLAPESLQLADSTHIWWLYPLKYDERIAPIYDKYDTKNFVDKSLDFIAKGIVKISVFFAFLSIFLFFYFFIFELSKNIESNQSMSKKIIN